MRLTETRELTTINQHFHEGTAWKQSITSESITAGRNA